MAQRPDTNPALFRIEPAKPERLPSRPLKFLRLLFHAASLCHCLQSFGYTCIDCLQKVCVECSDSVRKAKDGKDVRLCRLCAMKRFGSSFYSRKFLSDYTATSNKWFYSVDPLEVGLNQITPSQQILKQLKKNNNNCLLATSPDARLNQRRKSSLFEP